MRSKMNLSNKRPPNNVAKRCAEKFDLSNCKPIYTFGDTVYNPHNAKVDEFLIAHETVHAMQQGEHPGEWWNDYFSDKDFRFKEELAAYRVQFRVFCSQIKDRNEQARYLIKLANDLSSLQYGGLCTQSTAFKLIKQNVV